MDDAAPTQSVTQKLVKGAAWIMASRILINIITFASSILLARLLLPEDFGLVALATGLGAIATALSALPISEALIRTTHIEQDHFDSAFTLGLIRATALAILLLVLAWPTALLYQDDRLLPIMGVLAFNAFASGFFSARWPMLQKQLSFGPDFVMGVSSQIVGSVSSVLIAYYFRSYWAIVVPLALLQILCVVITHLYAPYRPRICFTRIPEIWSFSIWMTFSTTLNTINARIDTLLIGAVLGQRAVGFYSYGESRANTPTREISWPLIRVLFPGLSAVQHDHDRLASAYSRMQSVIFAVCAPAGVGFALVADQFVHVLLGDKWLPIIPIMQVISVVLACETIIVAVSPLAMTLGRTRELFTRDMIVFAIRMPVIILGLVLFGITGVLIARIVAMLSTVTIFLGFARNIVGVSVRDQLRGCSRSMAALAIMTLCTLSFKSLAQHAAGINAITLLATVAVGALSYAAAHGLFWLLAKRPYGVETELLKIFGNILNRRRRA